MRKLLFLFLLVLTVSSTKAQLCAGPGREPTTANAVCGNITFRQDQVFNCTGSGNLPNASAGCGDIVTTDNSIWYKFHCYQSGQLGFLLTPRSAGDDFDWEIVDITGRPPGDVYTTDLRVSLNLSGVTGPTGCIRTGSLDVHCGGGPPGSQFNQLINLIAGHDYLMMVNNWSSSGQGYDIDFTGTAVLTNNVPPTITEAKILGCDPSKIKVTFSEDILCNTIVQTGVGSEFTVTSTSGTHVINGIVSDCSLGARGVPSVIIDMQTPLAPGSYTLHVNTGSDGDVFKDVCLLEMLPVNIPFTVVAQPPLEIAAINFSGCAPTALDITFTKPFLCSSAAGNGTEFSITPGNPVISSSTFNCPGGRTTQLRINLQNPLSHGSYQLNINPGSDGNTIRDTCGMDILAGYQLAFVIPQTTVAPVIQAIDFNECHPNKVILNFDKPVLCTSLAADGSDFIVSPGSWPVAAMITDCGANIYATQVELTLQQPLPAGNFTININGGTDGNSIADTCYAFVTGTYSKSFVTTQAPAPKFDSLQYDRCVPGQVKVFYNRPILCTSITPDGSDYSITGPSAVMITSATTDVTCVTDGYTNWVTLHLSQQIGTPGNYVVHNSVGNDGNGVLDTCMATQNIAETIGINVLGAPAAVFNSQVIWACEKDTIIFSHPGGNGINSWEWVFSDGSTASGQIVRHEFPITTLTVNAQLTVSNGFCSDTKDQDITLGNTFSPAFSQIPKDTVCIHAPVTFTDESIGAGLAYEWQFGDLTQYIGQNPPPHPYNIAGSYNVKLILTDIHGCIDTADRDIVVTDVGKVDFLGLKAQYCTGNKLTLSKITSPYIYTYTWDNGNGETFKDFRTVQFSYPNEDLYTITLTADDKYCGPAIESKQVQVYAVPKVNLGKDTVLCPDEHLEIGVSNIPGYNYNWNTGAITSQVTTDIFTRQYILTADNHGCKATDSVRIKLLTACLITLPNAFTPNGDGRNDKLQAMNADLAKAFSLSVYNRFGELIFTTNDPLEGWDGTFKGNKVETGTYVWELRYINPWTLKPVAERGTSILIR